MKIAFFINNDQLEGLDWTNVLDGNPGAGGTEYLIVLEAFLMSREKDVEVVLYALRKSIFPESLVVKYVSSLSDSIIDANKNDIDFLIFKENQGDSNFSYLTEISKKTGLIIWCHNFLRKKALDVYASCSSVRAIICVGREMVDLYRDEKAFKKMDYIFNGCTFGNFDILNKTFIETSKRKNIVTYIGSIIPAKSFHWLAKAWPNVLKKVPDAELYVIGSGNLYDKNAKLGKYGIASEEYEKMFMPYLVDSSGKIIKSVHFMGKMGIEKNSILEKTKVGVPNPSGISETFGITAVEMQTYGCHVVTRKCAGYLDTVINKKHLYSYPFQLSEYIINGLMNPDTDWYATYSELKNKFDYSKTHKEWLRLISSLADNNSPKIHDLDTAIPNLCFHHKWLRVFNEKMNVHFHYSFPSELAWKNNRLYGKYKWYKDQIIEKMVK